MKYEIGDILSADYDIIDGLYLIVDITTKLYLPVIYPIDYEAIMDIDEAMNYYRILCPQDSSTFTFVTDIFRGIE